MAKLGPIVLGVVPCRLGSTRFPGKPLALLAGRPLLEHVLGRLGEATTVDGVLVATDSDEIAERARELGADVALVRQPCATGSDRTAVAIRGRAADVVVSLQVDQPFIDPSDIDKAVTLLERGFDITTLAYPCTDDAGYFSRDVVKVVVAEDGRALYFSRAAIPSSKAEVPRVARAAPAVGAVEAPGTGRNGLYLHHVGLYCFRRSALERFAAAPRGELETTECLEQLRALEMGLSIGVAIADRGRPGVDRPEDLEPLEELFASGEIELSP